MNSWKRCAGTVMVTMLLLLSGTAVAQDATGAATLPPIEAQRAPVAEKKSALKFRRGPTCMCATGTSEEDIRRAEEKRRAEEQK